MPDDFLDAVLGELRARMRKEQFETWFRGFRLVRCDRAESECDVEFAVPSGFVRDWLTRNYLPAIERAVQVVTRVPGHVNLVLDAGGIEIGSGGTAVFPSPTIDASSHDGLSHDGLSHDGLTHAGPIDVPVAGAVPAAEIPAVLPSARPETPPARAKREPAPAEVPVGESVPKDAVLEATPTAARPGTNDTKLNDQYTFSEFVVGTCNRLAHAAALAVGENPGRSFNPLFIHGNVGLGKTHLLQATCHAIRERRAGARVLYLSCEDFTNRFIQSIQAGKLSEFRDFHRNVDVLVIDDIQFLANKEKTQEEFFHTFNALYNDHRQIVLSSDRPPLDIPTIEERLVSRFKWGLVADMEVPCFETRIAIAKRKARSRGVELDDDVAYFVAERVDTNIRELEGAVVKVLGMASLTEREVCAALAEEALRGVATGRSAQVALGDVMDLITNEFSIPAREITGKGRTQAVSLPRQIGMFLCRELTDHSLEEVGRFFGNRDHTTVLYAVQKIKKRTKDDRMFRELVASLQARLANGR